MTNEHDDSGRATMTLPLPRDRASQADFLRELSLARRRVTVPPVSDAEGVAARLTTPVSLIVAPAETEDAGVGQTAATPWIVAFASPVEEPVIVQLPVDGGATDETAGPSWSALAIDAALRPENWFDTVVPGPTPEPVATSFGLFDIMPVTTWPATDPKEGIPGVGEPTDAQSQSDSAARTITDTVTGLFDDLPATTWPSLLPETGEAPNVSAELDDLLSESAWTFDRSEPVSETRAGWAPTVAPDSLDAISETVDRPDVAPLAPEPPPTVPVLRPSSMVMPAGRPPVVTPAAPITVRCTGLVASQTARGRRRAVLSGIELTVRSGEVAVITGRSGSGKTTLLECLAGLHRIDAGTVMVGETSLRDATDEQIADLRATTVGYVPQEPQLLADLSAVENIELPLLLSGWDAADARVEADAAVALVRLQSPDHRTSELSAGERRRVAIARALVGEPAILWLDEASAAIDPETMAEIYALIFELCHDGLTVVAATHDPVLLACANTTYVLRDGSLHPVVA